MPKFAANHLKIGKFINELNLSRLQPGCAATHVAALRCRELSCVLQTPANVC